MQIVRTPQRQETVLNEIQETSSRKIASNLTQQIASYMIFKCTIIIFEGCKNCFHVISLRINSNFIYQIRFTSETSFSKKALINF